MDTMPDHDPDRRARRDRRDPSRCNDYAGLERRRGPRRRAELPEPTWRRVPGLLLAAALGVIAALSLERMTEPAPEPASAVAASSPASEPVVDPELLDRARALRDEAELLTLAEVTLDEQAHERWLPRLDAIEAARTDPRTPPAVREELDATVAALVRVGLLPVPQ